MAFRLVEQEQIQETAPKSTLKGIGELAEGTAHAATTAATSGLSSVLGAPGDVLSFINEYAAGPLSELLTGDKAQTYEQMPISKYLQTSGNIKRNLHTAIPYTQPRNDYERVTNDVVETAAALLLPGAQAKVGRFIKSSPAQRALFKAIGAEGVKEGISDLTGDPGGGDLAKAGALFTMALLDRKSAAKYVGAIYGDAEKALQKAGNPTVAAGGLKNELTNLRNKLTRGTLAPSEQAVVNDLDAALGHFNGNNIPVENMWGVTRSLNEKKQDVIRSAASKEGRARARKLYDGVIRSFNKELDSYGKTNPEFGKPFKDAQEAYATLAKSNFLTNWAKKNLNYSPDNKWLPYVFGTALAGSGKIAGSLSPGAVAAPAALYQAGKFLYRIQKSPTLRKYYLEALSAAAKEDAALFNRSVEKMDKVIDREDKGKAPYRLLEDES